MPPAYFVVRATVADPSKRAAFDSWYSREHMPDAVKSFGTEKAWRFWSLSDPSLHQATYQFSDRAALERATGGEEMKRLVADTSYIDAVLADGASRAQVLAAETMKPVKDIVGFIRR